MRTHLESKAGNGSSPPPPKLSVDRGSASKTKGLVAGLRVNLKIKQAGMKAS